MRRCVIVVVGLLASAVGYAQSFESEARRFARAYMSYNPKGVMEVKVDHNGLTPAGPYLLVSVTRRGEDEKSNETLSLLVDPQRRTASAGLVATLPPIAGAVTTDRLQRYVQQDLPPILTEMLGMRTRLRWPSGPERPTGVVPLTAELSTGYGWTKWPMALSADGKYIVLGATWPLDRDPRAVRRDIIDDALVQWDPGNEKAVVKFVEFSDYECPACKRAWGEVKPVLAKFAATLRHGLVNLPLVRSHPWAFRAAVAGTCVGSLWADKLLAFKDEMYRLQDAVTVDTVDDAIFGFLLQQSLDEKAFRGCYLKDPAIDRVLAQIELGQRLGILGTPTYFANGEHLAYGDKDLLVARLEAIIAAGGIPEKVPQ